MNLKSRSQYRLRLVDFIIVILCLSTMAYSINLFRRDLSQTIDLYNVKPVGTIIIKKNTVQRRVADRVLWDRLRVESPVYLGDTIRVAELSAAMLDIDGQQIDINENTLICILPTQDGSGALQIELSEGSLSVTTGADGGIQLAIQGRVIKMESGTALTATAGKDGFSAQINKGTAAFNDDRTVTQGELLSFNAEGAELRQPAAVMTNPRPNARYVKNTPQPLSVGFAWNRINLDTNTGLRLEIAADRNFNRIVQSVENLNTFAEILLDAGLWNWRLSNDGAILSAGQLSVTEASNLNLLSPIKGSLFRYQDDPPPIRFQWSEFEEASHYIIEISPIQDFSSPHISRQTSVPFFIDSYLSPGTWYWRVQPFFSSVYEGAAGFSPISYFDIERAFISTDDEIIVLPEPEIKPVVTVQVSPPIQEVSPLAQEVAAPIQEISPLAQEVAAPIQEISAPVQEKTPPVRQVNRPPPPPLPPPGNRHPANGRRIGIEELKAQRKIVFNWSGVAGANAYTITLYEQTASGRRQIRRIPLGNNTTWTLDNVGLLGRGEFVWRVEASYIRRDGTVERPGRPGENSFVIDIPLPAVHMENPGVLYGF
jgi:hypothetical protein